MLPLSSISHLPASCLTTWIRLCNNCYFTVVWVGPWEHGTETFGSIKGGLISWLAEWLLAPEGLWCMELHSVECRSPRGFLLKFQLTRLELNGSNWTTLSYTLVQQSWKHVLMTRRKRKFTLWGAFPLRVISSYIPRIERTRAKCQGGIRRMGNAFDGT